MTSVHPHLRLSGALIFAAFATGLISVAPAIDSADYLVEAAKAPTQVQIAATGQIVMALCYLGFALLLFPHVRRASETLALGFLGFRVIATGVAIVATVVMLALLSLSHLAVALPAGDLAGIAVVGETLRIARDQLNHVFMVVALSVGNAMFYLLTFRARLLPRWLALFGIAGALLSVAASGAILFGTMDIITVEYIALNMPTAMSDLILGLWLLFKGFRPAPVPA
jgi:Domain of unknown function (DUF4386)